jgi:hypothetical protein
VPERISPEGWRELLRHGTAAYAAQPYQQLAAGYRARGDDRQVRETLMAQRDDQLARADTSWRERWWGKITKITLGDGYQPWRALLFLAAVVAVSCVLAVVLGAHGALAQTSKTATLAGRARWFSRSAWDWTLTFRWAPAAQGGLRPDHGFGQCDRGLADRCRLDLAATGLDVRGVVHRRLHQRRTQDMISVPLQY